MTKRTLAAMASGAVALAAALLPARAVAEKPPAPPSADAFTKEVLGVVASYPTDGTHAYYWPKGSSWTGTTCDLTYEGKTICKGDPQGRCYCCGLTFEVFFLAYQAYCKDHKLPFKILDLDADGVEKLRRQWFGAADDRHTLDKAVTDAGLGRVVKLEDARAGDFCQLWRRGGSGHSVVVLDVVKDDSGKPVALHYWSTQKSTNGIGERTEKFTDSGKSGLIPEETYIARIGEAD